MENYTPEQNNSPEIPLTPPDPTSPLYAPAKPLSPSFSAGEAVCAWVCFVLGFIFCRYVAGYAGGIWGGIFWALVGALAAVFAKMKKLPVSRWQAAVFAISELFCFVPLFSANRLVNFLAAVFSYFLLFYLAVTVSGAELFGKHFVSDLFRGLLVRPFSRFDKAPRAAFSLFKGGQNARNVLYVLLGLVLALPLTIVVVIILMRSDGAFESLIDSTFGNIPEFSFSVIWQILFGVLVGMYLFGMLFSAGEKAAPQAEGAPFWRVVPAPVACAAVTPVCLFYLLYIITQLGYFTAAFGGTLPEGYSYSEFARRGFFELFVVAVINLGVIVVIQTFVKRHEGDARPAALKVYTVVISVFTLLLIASAFSKMFMYISNMGMTPLRIYTSWFMPVLAAAFVLIIISQFREMKFWRVMFAAFTVMFGVLCFANVDGMIASYNVSAFLDGRLETVDYDVLEDLSVAAVKPLDRLSGSALSETSDESGKAVQALRYISDNMDESPAYFSIPSAEAQMILEKYGFD